MIGGVPAYCRDAEASVLGAILSAGGCEVRAGHRILERARAAGLTADSFWFPSHAALFAILEQRAAEGLALDSVSIAAAIEDEAWRRLGSLAELALTGSVDVEVLRGRLEMLAASVTAFSNVEAHAAIVVERARRREAAA